MASGMGGSFPCLKTMPSTNPGGTVSKSEGGRDWGGGGGGGRNHGSQQVNIAHSLYTDTTDQSDPVYNGIHGSVYMQK